MCIRDRYTLGAVTIIIEVPGPPQLSAEGALALTAVICSTVFFLLGMLCMYFLMRCKRSHATKNDRPADVVLPQLPVPVYEDIDIHRLDKPVSPRSPGSKQTIELKENVAYGPM